MRLCTDSQSYSHLWYPVSMMLAYLQLFGRITLARYCHRHQFSPLHRIQSIVSNLTMLRNYFNASLNFSPLRFHRIWRVLHNGFLRGPRLLPLRVVYLIYHASQRPWVCTQIFLIKSLGSTNSPTEPYFQSTFYKYNNLIFDFQITFAENFAIITGEISFQIT